MISPFTFPVTTATFNFVSCCPICISVIDLLSTFQACVIFGSITFFGIVSWYFTPEERWLRRELLLKGLQTTDQPEGSERSMTGPLSED